MHAPSKGRVGGHLVLVLTLALTGNLVACGGSQPEAQWARTVQPVPMGSFFDSVAVDSLGSVYAAGDLWGAGTLNFGNNVTAAGTSGGTNVLLAKYDSSGQALWAQTFAANGSNFNSVAVDFAGNVYATGYVSTASGPINVGNGITLTESSTAFSAVLVKYNSLGIPQWAQTVASSPDASAFSSMAVDSAGNVYAAGFIGGAGTYDFGNNVMVTSTATIQYSTIEQASNVVLVKYSSSGVPLWAQTVTSASGPSGFASVVVDSAGSVYAAGGIASAQDYDFGNGVNATSTPVGDPVAAQECGSVVLVKYNSSGIAQWAQTCSFGGSGFESVAVDSVGSVYAAGYVMGTQSYDFGNGVTATGISGPNVNCGVAGPESLVVVKYDASGIAEWARTVSTARTSGLSLAISSSGSVFAAGNRLLVKYNSSGISQSANSAEGSGEASFSAVAVDSTDNVYLAGGISGTMDFGVNVTATGAYEGAGSGWSALLVKYR